ncbi:MAG: DHA2 family efflux MFS transporter permease subunit [Streptosporangiales bacterium]|nr:DHA2 family efflux MFS transporter permease subunit [Streptosporangiales bacterium]
MARRWKVLLVTSAAVFMAMLDVTIVNIAFPDLRASFPRESMAGLSWILNAYAIVFAAALVPAGRLADRFGRKRLFVVGVLVFLAASVACGLAGSVEMLVAGRIFQALGGAILTPASLSLILPEFPVEQRATATSLWAATGAVAAATGPSLGGVLVDWQGWRMVFFVNLAIGLPALLPARRLLREGREERAVGWPDAAGALLLALGVAALALAIIEGEDWGWTSGGVLGAFAAAVVLLVAFVVRSASHRSPVIDLALFRVRSFAAAGAGTFVFGIGFFALLLCNVLFLATAWGYPILLAGVALTPGPIAAALTAPVAGRLADRFGQRAVAVPGSLVFAAGPLLLALGTGPQPQYWADFFPAAVLGGGGVGLTMSAFTSAAVAELPRPRFATGIAIVNCLRQLGAVVGIAVLVTILGGPGPEATVDAFHRAWAVMAGAGLLTAVIAITLGRIHARDVETVGPSGRPVTAPTTLETT